MTWSAASCRCGVWERRASATSRTGPGRIQLFLNAGELGEGTYAEALELLDVGDFVAAGGPVFRTRTGESSVRVRRYRIAAKALRPLPEKWHGLHDAETRYRQRYLDLIANPAVRERFRARATIIQTIRRVLDERGFLEVETPTLQPLYGGGAAEPFVTHYHALDRPYYLRIADELYLKRLLVGGLERVYEICKDFRNEGIDTTHSPEFTMLEAYQAFADLDGMMELTEALVAETCTALHGATTVDYQGTALNFAPPWRRLSYRDALLEATGLNLDDEPAVTNAALRSVAAEHEIHLEFDWTQCAAARRADADAGGTSTCSADLPCPLPPRNGARWRSSRTMTHATSSALSLSCTAWRLATPTPN